MCERAPQELKHTVWTLRYSDVASNVLGDLRLKNLKKKEKEIKETLVLILHCRENSNLMKDNMRFNNCDSFFPKTCFLLIFNFIIHSSTSLATQ